MWRLRENPIWRRIWGMFKGERDNKDFYLLQTVKCGGTKVQLYDVREEYVV